MAATFLVEAQEKTGGVALRIFLPVGSYDSQGIVLTCEDGEWKATSAVPPVVEPQEEARFVTPMDLGGPPQRVRRKPNG